jgi:hypothetical protein
MIRKVEGLHNLHCICGGCGSLQHSVTSAYRMRDSDEDVRRELKNTKNKQHESTVTGWGGMQRSEGSERKKDKASSS